MQTFVNGFQIVVNQDKSEIVLNFLQRVPSLDQNGAVVGVVEHPVSNLVMTGENARQLATALTASLNIEVILEENNNV